jgi:hypothetical protein
MKSLLLLLFCSYAVALPAETFQDITTRFPIGSTKDAILEKEPSATVVPCRVSPIDPTARSECIVLTKATEKKRIIAQFFLVNDAVAAMFLSSVTISGEPENKEQETAYIASHRKLSTFSALRADANLKPFEIEVERLSLDRGKQVALLASTEQGIELWIVDESIFDSQRFFMEPTEDNREKILKGAEVIDAQRRKYEEAE